MFHDQPNPTERLDAMPRHHSSAPTWPSAEKGISTPYPLLDTFARKNYDLIAMLEAGVSMDQLTHYANNDAAIEQLRKIHTMGLLGLSIRAMEARHIAINKLIDTIQREDLPVRELRLCLTMLIRAGAQRLLDGSKIPEAPTLDPPTPPSSPTPAPTNPDATPSARSGVADTSPALRSASAQCEMPPPDAVPAESVPSDSSPSCELRPEPRHNAAHAFPLPLPQVGVRQQVAPARTSPVTARSVRKCDTEGGESG